MFDVFNLLVLSLYKRLFVLNFSWSSMILLFYFPKDQTVQNNKRKTNTIYKNRQPRIYRPIQYVDKLKIFTGAWDITTENIQKSD